MNLSKQIGLQLRQARESLGMTITDVARKTNIELKYLIAIERGEWDRLPNAVYARAYVKAYAQLVGQNIQMTRASRRGPVTNHTQTRFQTQYRNQSRIHTNIHSTAHQAYNTEFQTTKRRRQIQAEVIDVDQREESKQDAQKETLSRRSKSQEKEQTVRSTQSIESLPSRREKAKEKKKKQGDLDALIDVWYTRILIAGGILLALGYGYFMILKFTSTPGIPLA